MSIIFPALLSPLAVIYFLGETLNALSTGSSGGGIAEYLGSLFDDEIYPYGKHKHIAL